MIRGTNNLTLKNAFNSNKILIEFKPEEKKKMFKNIRKTSSKKKNMNKLF